MNDGEQVHDSALTRDLRESLTGIAAPPRPPLATITARGRTHRRHRLTGIAGLSAAGVAAGCAVALGLTGVFAFGSTSHQPSHSAHAQLAAWTVTKMADGNITVTINQLHDPAGLQSTLNADGVPASVTFLRQQNPACAAYPGGRALLSSIVTGQLENSNGNAMIIDPSAIPSGAGLQIATTNVPSQPGPGFWINTDVIQASQQCTGS